MIPIGPLPLRKVVLGERVKRDPDWWIGVKATCCKSGAEQLVRNVLDWSLECDGCGGFDNLQYCPWCGKKLPTSEELQEAVQK